MVKMGIFKYIILVSLLLILLIPSVNAGLYLNEYFPFIHYEGKSFYGADSLESTSYYNKSGLSVEGPSNIYGINPKAEIRFHSEDAGTYDVYVSFEKDVSKFGLYEYENVSRTVTTKSYKTRSSANLKDGNTSTETYLSDTSKETVWEMKWVELEQEEIEKEEYYYDEDLGEYWYKYGSQDFEKNESKSFLTEMAINPMSTKTNKYSVCLIPSEYDLEEGLTRREGVCLDPAWTVGAEKRTYINITNNLVYSVNFTYNVTMNLSTFDSSNITITNDDASVTYNWVNKSYFVGNDSAEFFLDLRNLSTGVSSIYFWQMNSSQDTFTFDNFSSGFWKDSGAQTENAGVASSNFWTLSANDDPHYNYTLNHWGKSNGAIRFIGDADEDRIAQTELSSLSNTSVIAYWYYDGTTQTHEDWMSIEGSKRTQCGYIPAESTTNITCKIAGGATVTAGVALEGWHEFRYDVNSNGSMTVLYDGTPIYRSEGVANGDIWINVNSRNATYDDIILTPYYFSEQPNYTQGDQEELVDLQIDYPTNITYSTPVTSMNYSLRDKATYDYCWNSIAGVNSTPVTAGENFTGLSATVGSNTWYTHCNSSTTELRDDISFTFTEIAPNVTIEYPTNTSYPFNTAGVSTLNYTIRTNTYTPTNCWYSTIGDNSSQVTAGTNWTGLFSQYGTNNTWTVWCNDSNGLVGSDNITFTINYNLTYIQNQTIRLAGDGDENKFELYLFLGNVSDTWSDTTANLSFNGTTYVAGRYEFDDYIRFSKSLNIPTGIGNASGHNITWFWNYDIQNGTSTMYLERNTTSELNTTVYSLEIGNCTQYGKKIINWTLYDEETFDTDLNNGSIEGSIYMYSYDNPAVSYNHSANTTNGTGISSLSICASSGAINQSTNGYIANLTARYWSDDHVVEFYHRDNHSVTNTSSLLDVSLYALDSDDSTSFIMEYRNDLYVPQEDVILDLQRFYVGENIWRSVEWAKTDADGETILHFHTEDVIYRVYARYLGQLDFMSDDFTAICESTPCTIYLQDQSEMDVIGDWDTEENLSYTFDLNRASRKVDFEYTITTGDNEKIGMNVTQMNARNNNTICAEEQNAPAGTISCTIPLTADNTTYYIDIYRDGEFILSRYFSVAENAQDVFGNIAIIMTAVIFLTASLIGMALGGGIMTVIFGLIGIITAGVINLIDVGNVFGIGSAIMFLIVAGMILILKMSNRRNS